jgi:hypothetical protein
VDRVFTLDYSNALLGYKKGVEMESSQEMTLPSFEERQQILARAGVVLAEARALIQCLDHPEGLYVGDAPINSDNRENWGQFMKL